MSRRSSQWGQLGDMPSEMLTLTGLRFTQRIHREEGFATEYGFDLIPLAFTSAPYTMSVGARGVGVNPISLTAVFRTDHALQVRLGGSAGVLWFDRPVPTPTAAQLNFTGSVEAGLQLIDVHGHGIVALYRFHHLSNAGIGTDNPGMASNIISLGGRWRVGRR
jgi:hypothetical protein